MYSPFAQQKRRLCTRCGAARCLIYVGRTEFVYVLGSFFRRRWCVWRPPRFCFPCLFIVRRGTAVAAPRSALSVFCGVLLPSALHRYLLLLRPRRKNLEKCIFFVAEGYRSERLFRFLCFPLEKREREIIAATSHLVDGGASQTMVDPPHSSA